MSEQTAAFPNQIRLIKTIAEIDTGRPGAYTHLHGAGACAPEGPLPPDQLLLWPGTAASPGGRVLLHSAQAQAPACHVPGALPRAQSAQLPIVVC